MTISTRLGVIAVSTAVALALGIGAFAVATPANADPVSAEPTPSVSTSIEPTVAATAEPSTTTTASPTPTASPTTAAPKPAKKAKKKGKAKISNAKRLTKRAQKVAFKVRRDWYQIKRIGGWRAGSRYSGDHPAGRAIDVMIPSWKKNATLGRSIAKYFTKHAKKYTIHYVIFRQKIWTVQNPHWRTMASRGGATANHFDHVHISVKR
ncbi:hypothetical protein [Micropruina sp.]|uniref:hypothetical protein n=1 Tax=Micropruina sp. TaxID=2737536 RepID=UPI0039E6856D